MTKSPFSNLHVLVIDDEEFMRQLLVRLLNNLGIHTVSEAQHGVEGMTRLRLARRKVNLVICDLEMPRMNGHEFVEKLRSGDSGAPDPDIPVIILTGHADEENVHDASRLGINGYIVKPISRNVLEERLKAALVLPPVAPIEF